MIYAEDDEETVDSGLTCSNTGGAHTDHRSSGELPLPQPSQTHTADTDPPNTFEDIQQPYKEDGKRYSIDGKLGGNEGWEFEQGWSENRITKHTNTTLPPSPVLVKEGVEGAPVGSGPVLQKPK